MDIYGEVLLPLILPFPGPSEASSLPIIISTCRFCPYTSLPFPCTDLPVPAGILGLLAHRTSHSLLVAADRPSMSPFATVVKGFLLQGPNTIGPDVFDEMDYLDQFQTGFSLVWGQNLPWLS